MNELFPLNNEELQIVQELFLSYENHAKISMQLMVVGAILMWVSVGAFPSWFKFFLALAYSIFIPIYLYPLYGFRNSIEEDLNSKMSYIQTMTIDKANKKTTLYGVEEFFIANNAQEKYQVYPYSILKDLDEQDKVQATILPKSKIIISIKKL